MLQKYVFWLSYASFLVKFLPKKITIILNINIIFFIANWLSWHKNAKT